MFYGILQLHYLLKNLLQLISVTTAVQITIFSDYFLKSSGE